MCPLWRKSTVYYMAKIHDLPAKWSLCGESHPTNYRGRPIHKNFNQKKSVNSKKNISPLKTDPKCDTTPKQNTFPSKSYAKAINVYPTNPYSNTSSTDSETIFFNFSSFFDDFKSLINPLIALLTTVINKILNSNDK